MTEILTTVDPWFLNLCIIALAAYFLWSVKGLFADLKESIADLKKLISDLYDHRNDHESRIVALETKCSIQHGEMVPLREGLGRRSTDYTNTGAGK